MFYVCTVLVFSYDRCKKEFKEFRFCRLFYRKRLKMRPQEIFEDLPILESLINQKIPKEALFNGL